MNNIVLWKKKENTVVLKFCRPNLNPLGFESRTSSFLQTYLTT